MTPKNIHKEVQPPVGLFPPVGETFVLRTSVTQLQGTRQQGALYYVGVKYLYDK